MNKVEKIENLYDLARLAHDKKAVFVPSSLNWKKPKPASFILNLQGNLILELFRIGMYVYKSKKQWTTDEPAIYIARGMEFKFKKKKEEEE